MSLDFRSKDPIKGVDGNEYQICPKCGDDMLELHGDDPIGWGWTIACTNCEWEMKQAEELDISQYSDLMDEIKLRVEAIHQITEMPGIITQTRVESACLQLRMVLGLIVLYGILDAVYTVRGRTSRPGRGTLAIQDDVPPAVSIRPNRLQGEACPSALPGATATTLSRR